MQIFVDLVGKSVIKCTNGMKAEVEFVPVGWFVGEYFTIKGLIKAESDAVKKPYCTISGKWTQESTYFLDGVKIPLFDPKREVPHLLHVPYLQDQDDTESQKLWGPVTEALKSEDYGAASELKTVIEEAQRAIRKQRKDNGESWSPAYFEFAVADRSDSNGTTHRDPQTTGGKEDEEQGHWIFQKTILYSNE